MLAPNLKFARFLLLVALGLIACLVMGAASSGGPWPDGESYRFCYGSGSFGYFALFSGEMRTFGGAPFTFTSGLFGESYVDRFWDATDTAGLQPNQVRLVFYLTRESSSSGSLPGEVLTILSGLQPPPGATYLEDSARITFAFSSGAPLTIGPTFDGIPVVGTFTSGMCASGTFASGCPLGYYFDGSRVLSHSGLLGQVTGMTYEIVVDNVPEPVTLGVFASGALLLTGRLVARNRRKA